MPSQDTWTPIENNIQNSGKGRKRTWVNTPGFGALAKDEKPVNQYTDWVSTATQISRVWYTQVNGGSPVYTYNGPAKKLTEIAYMAWQFMLYADGVKPFPDLVNSAKVKALGKISDAKINLAVSLAEFSKTTTMILDTARRIDRSYRAFRKGNLREVARQLDLKPTQHHKSWLSYKYGWMPLLMEVRGAAELLAQQQIERKPRFTVVAKETDTRVVTRIDQSGRWGSPTITDPLTHVLTDKYTVKVKVWCELSNSRLHLIQQMGLTNPALVAWELIPFSFVFDWFIQVGDYLNALTALNGVTVRRAYYSKKLDRSFSRTFPASRHTEGSTTYITNGAYEAFENDDYGRYVWVPSPFDIYPPKGNSLSVEKLITGLALIRGSYRG